MGCIHAMNSTSTIQPNLPVQGAGATTQSIRDNFQRAKNDIESLLNATVPITGNLVVEGSIRASHPGGGIRGSYATFDYAYIYNGITADSCSGQYLSFNYGYIDGFRAYYASDIYQLYATYANISSGLITYYASGIYQLWASYATIYYGLYCPNNCSGQYLSFNNGYIDGLSAYSCSGSYLNFGTGSFWGNLKVVGIPMANQTMFSPITSMRAAKEDIAPYERGIEAVTKLQPVTFRYNGMYDTYDNGSFYHGLIAEDVGTVMPEMIKYRTPEIQTIDNSPLLYAMVNSIKEHERRITALENG